ncbi:lipopolysaccharide-induced tumor necrosis factor-alpha factor homolog [Mytilus trossulus]|uniref:lipopolysaccharide-induced tumor necrosis factor-alpha factor homolog n=1 Tax=Mytilus trossulus TaxID=6551 RepID=UPI003003CC16
MEKGSPYPAQQPPPPQYNQPPPAYAPPGQQTAATVVIQQPHVLLRQTFREVPVRLNCQSCQADIMTATNYETGMLTWMAVGIICLFGGWLGCCLIPFCIDACKDVVHTCPNCKQMVGKYNRLS